MTKLYAQPYDISANGFSFETYEEFNEKAAKAKNRYGDPVEEYELQFIDGEALDSVSTPEQISPNRRSKSTPLGVIVCSGLSPA